MKLATKKVRMSGRLSRTSCLQLMLSAFRIALAVRARTRLDIKKRCRR